MREKLGELSSQTRDALTDDNYCSANSILRNREIQGQKLFANYLNPFLQS